jgi:hypothetical protein
LKHRSSPEILPVKNTEIRPDNPSESRLFYNDKTLCMKKINSLLHDEKVKDSLIVTLILAAIVAVSLVM